jgi:hypothetical protein
VDIGRETFPPPQHKSKAGTEGIPARTFTQSPGSYPLDSDAVDAGRTREQQWLREHGKGFPGKWLALFGTSLISQGQTAKEVLTAARTKGFARPLVIHISEEPDLPFGGW